MELLAPGIGLIFWTLVAFLIVSPHLMTDFFRRVFLATKGQFTLEQCSLLRTVGPQMRRYVDVFEPDAVVSFHPLLNQAAVRLSKERPRAVPAITVITDLVDVHASWACAEGRPRAVW